MAGQPIVTDIGQGVGLTTPEPAVRTVKVLLSPLLQDGLEDFSVGITEVPPHGEGTRHNHPHAAEVWLFFAGRGPRHRRRPRVPHRPRHRRLHPARHLPPVHQHRRRTGQALLPVRPRRRGTGHPGRRVPLSAGFLRGRESHVSTRRAASGALSRTRSSALAAPVGQRLPCSQLRERLARHVDAPRELDLRQPETPPNATGVLRHVLHRLGVVMALLGGGDSLGRAIQHRVIETTWRKASPIVQINPHACLAHTREPPSCSLCEPKRSGSRRRASRRSRRTTGPQSCRPAP